MAEPRRISVFLPDLRGGGAERVVVAIATALADHHDVELVLASGRGALRGEVPDHVAVSDLGARRVLAAVPRLAAHLRRRRPDAVLSALNHANVAAVAARVLSRTPMRLVVSEHNNLSVASQHAPARRDRLLPWVLGPVYQQADAVVAVSAGVADDLSRRCRLSRDAVHVIANPIDVASLQRRAAAPADHPWSRDRAPGGPFLALAAGRLTPQKDFGTLIEAVAIARRSVDLRLLILGEGEERSALSHLVDRLGLGSAVALPGFCAEPYPHFAACDVYVLSSRWEGLPTVLLEASALSPRIVATDCPSGPREILGDHPSATLVPVGDPAALAAGIVSVLSRPGRPRPEALAPCSPAAIGAAYADILLPGSGPR